MELSFGLMAGMYALPLLIWVGIMLFIRTLTGEVSQVQSTILFLLAFFLLASLLMLNVAVRANVVLLTLALIETLLFAGTIGFQLKKLTAKQ